MFEATLVVIYRHAVNALTLHLQRNFTNEKNYECFKN